MIIATELEGTLTAGFIIKGLRGYLRACNQGLTYNTFGSTRSTETLPFQGIFMDII
jgi:hypothetical protein